MFHEFDELAKSMDEVIKAGEGSRGGKVIGHTSSGKPIYETAMQHIDSGIHSSYTAKDHKEAARLHSNNEKMQKFHTNWQNLKGKPIGKSLSHDPFRPHEMSENSGYYNPYRFVDGAFLPHSVEYWREQGKQDDYTQTSVFYDRYMRTSRTFKSFIELVGEDLVKAGAVPIGTVHVYNGVQYKKMGEGNWQPVGQKKPANIEQDHTKIETAASGHIEKIQNVLKEKYKEQASKQEHSMKTHEALTEFAHAIFGAELPDNVKEHLAKKEKELNKPNVHPSAVQPIQNMQKEFGKRHNVDIAFKINGQEYKHTFKDVSGNSQDEVTAKVEKMMKQKLPHANITRVKTSLIKDEKKSNYLKELKGDKNESTREIRH